MSEKIAIIVGHWAPVDYPLQELKDKDVVSLKGKPVLIIDNDVWIHSDHGGYDHYKIGENPFFVGRQMYVISLGVPEECAKRLGVAQKLNELEIKLGAA